MKTSPSKDLLATALSAIIGSKISEQRAESGLIGAAIGFGAAALARRSLPGALIVGGALLARELYQRNQEKAAAPKTRTKANGSAKAAKTPGKLASTAKPKSRAKKPVARSTTR